MRRLRDLLVLFLLAAPAHALVIDEPLAEPAQERTAQELFHALRCMVCEGQSLAESDAVFAQQMRNEIRRQLKNGKSAKQVKDYFVTRYGAVILQTPPLNAVTALLWAMPILFLILAAWIMRPRRRGERP